MGNIFWNIIFPLHAAWVCRTARKDGCELQYTCYNYTGLASEASQIVNRRERWLSCGYYDFITVTII